MQNVITNVYHMVFESGTHKSRTVARGRQFYIKRSPYMESLVIKIRKISNLSLHDEKDNSSGQSNSSYNQNVQTLGTHQTEILHV